MVLQNRLDYVFNGYQVPRAARSARRRGSYRKKIQDSRQCAIDLLATVAGKLLLEGENFLTAGKKSTGKDQCEILQSSVRKEESNKENSPKINLCDRLNVHNQSSSLKECTHKNAFSGHASVITTFDCSQRFASAAVFGERKREGGDSARIEVGLSRYGEFGHQKLKDMPDHHLTAEPLKTENIVAGNGAVQCSTDDAVVLDGKPSALVSSDSSAKKPIFGDSVPSPSFHNFREAVNVVSCSRDDDENSSGCTQPSTTRMAYRSPMRITDRRVRKLLASKYWNQPQKQNDGELSNIGRKLNAGYSNSNACYTRQRSQASFPIKKRKLLDYSSVSSSDGGTCSEGLPNSSRMGINRDVSGYHAEMLGANGTTSLIGAQHTSSSRDSHVKLRIKSFRVPELFIDIPETATIGSLKRNVKKAVNALLRGGLHVGVVLRGKKVRDDNKTLIQTGISQDNKLDSLGFALEPNPSKAPKSLGPEGHLCLMPSDKFQPLIRYLPSTNIVHQATFDSDPLTNLGNLMESDHCSAPSPTDASMEKSSADSQALVAVPVHHRSNRVEIVQRRIRRPFSVSEVEALVQAVEKLGTGRWRDVKVGAFDNAKHRTYVDLKDKWKTLVHTARISPQQRRGETVPQDLLDRVLAAHAYWSKRQSKQHLKQEQRQHSPHPPHETFLLL